MADALQAFGHIDILLCCNTEGQVGILERYKLVITCSTALFGTVEELSQSERTQTLVRDQFATNFFAPINMIKAVLPSMRENKDGHILLLSAVSELSRGSKYFPRCTENQLNEAGHLGTPGLGMYCASQWAIEGYCDSLAYEIAPFNIRLSIIQSSIEISILTNRITAVPAMPQYMLPQNPAPLSRGLFARILDQVVDEDPSPATGVSSPVGQVESGLVQPRSSAGERLRSNAISTLYPSLIPEFCDNLIAETVHALIAIGGHDNPPARHIVGFEGIASVKEKLKTVSEELEDFIEASGSVDL